MTTGSDTGSDTDSDTNTDSDRLCRELTWTRAQM